MTDMQRPRSNKKDRPSSLIGPRDSNAKDRKVYEEARPAYLASFFSAAFSAAAPAETEVTLDNSVQQDSRCALIAEPPNRGAKREESDGLKRVKRQGYQPMGCQSEISTLTLKR